MTELIPLFPMFWAAAERVIVKMLDQELQKRGIPPVLSLPEGGAVRTAEQWIKRRQEILTVFRREMYGFAPPAPQKIESRVLRREDQAFAGKAQFTRVELSFETYNGIFSFPMQLSVPKNKKNPPVFLTISFSPALTHDYLPTEELLDNGYAVASFYYQDVAPDRDDDFVSGIAGLYSRNPFDSWGKISMWAYAASRVMDYLQTLDGSIDARRVAVVGHSRLGKTALWCGAQDERFSLVIVNNAGAGGAALFRGKKGERIQNLTDVPHYWFCGNFKKYAGHEEKLPFDQHFALALAAPRGLYVCSARQDDWSDPESEFLSCAAASPVYGLFGEKGLVTPDRLPDEDSRLQEGTIGYHMRAGTHYLSRYDWQQFMHFRSLHPQF